MTDAPLPAELAVDEEPFPVEAVDQMSLLRDGDLPDEAAKAYHWRIEDHGAAEWAMRRLAEARANIAAVEEQAAEWNRRIDEWTAKVLAPLLNREQFFLANLEDYGLRVREASGDEVKTLLLPSGKIKTASHGPKVKVGDPLGFADWAAANPDDELVRTTYALAAVAVKGRMLVQEKVAGVEWGVQLDCGHTRTGGKAYMDETDPPGPPKVGDPHDCIACSDPISGPAQRRVEAVEAQEVVELIARDATTGEAIAWATVEPASTTAKVVVE